MRRARLLQEHQPAETHDVEGQAIARRSIREKKTGGKIAHRGPVGGGGVAPSRVDVDDGQTAFFGQVIYDPELPPVGNGR